MAYPFQIKSLNEYHEQYKKSIDDPETFWGDIAGHFSWVRKWDSVFQWSFTEPSVKWFLNGQLNITENCLDRHLDALGDKAAIIWEPNGVDEQGRIITYKELHHEVCRFAAVLQKTVYRRATACASIWA
jgi:acetyl-CoA synthetase